ncbi:hypothetical protein C2845_PM03G27820 [Panicum miliaceum]|uniref:Uncharacterized protein n=1 Tax=Panicum miliaceum TaxID=4540 RepID=A0A3L6T801_PANMI|nr:hypothetical protein C2845_PM03G27820 [Panicum miliaceum]
MVTMAGHHGAPPRLSAAPLPPTTYIRPRAPPCPCHLPPSCSRFSPCLLVLPLSQSSAVSSISLAAAPRRRRGAAGAVCGDDVTFEEGQEQQCKKENQFFDEEGKWISPLYMLYFCPNDSMKIHFTLFVEMHKLDGNAY